MSLNVSNIPLNTLYQFNDDLFIISFMLNESRQGKYQLRESKKFTEVYQINAEGEVARLASGEIVENSRIYNYERNFAIFDYESNNEVYFAVNMPIIDVTDERLYQVSDFILKEKQNNRRK